jgi:hypothetical protein
MEANEISDIYIDWEDIKETVRERLNEYKKFALSRSKESVEEPTKPVVNKIPKNVRIEYDGRYGYPQKRYPDCEVDMMFTDDPGVGEVTVIRIKMKSRTIVFRLQGHKVLSRRIYDDGKLNNRITLHYAPNIVHFITRLDTITMRVICDTRDDYTQTVSATMFDDVKYVRSFHFGADKFLCKDGRSLTGEFYHCDIKLLSA